MGRSRAAVGLMKEPAEKSISQQDKRNLKTLVDDFGLLHRKEVQDIIANCTSYE